MKGYPHLLYVLVLSQVSLSLLAGVGEAVFVGTAVYLIVPVLRGTVLIVAAVAAGRGFTGDGSRPGAALRRWPLVLLVICAQLSVLGLVVSTVAGVLPWFSDTVNLVGLLTNLALPLAITWLSARMLSTWRRPPTPVVALPSLSPLPRTLVDPMGGAVLVPVTKILPREDFR